jgi:hypothetical protein
VRISKRRSCDPSLVHLAVAPQWDSLRADPRLAARLAAMGLAAVPPPGGRAGEDQIPADKRE